jgi:hypothetical protein
MVIADLENMETYGSPPELSIDEHHWIKVFESVSIKGFYTLVVCKHCGSLGRRNNSSSWEHCKPNGEWLTIEQEPDESWNLCSNSLWQSLGYRD